MERENLMNPYSVESQGRTLAFATLMKNVYLWMTLALAVTGLTAAYVAMNPGWVYAIATNSVLFFGLIIAELAVVMILSARPTPCRP